MEKIDSEKPDKNLKIYKILSRIGLIIVIIWTVLNLTNDTGLLPTFLDKKLSSLSKLFYTNKLFEIIVFTVMILFIIGIVFVKYKLKQTTGKMEEANRMVWIFLACAIFGLIIMAIFW